jgi:hypothetical protein
LNCGNRLLPATPSPQQPPARLILLTDNGEILQEYLLEKLEISIGRAPESHILLSRDKLTSRRHAMIRYENGRYVLRDEGSTTGTFVNEQRLEAMVPRILHDGDRIRIGGHKLLFRTGVYRQEQSIIGNSTTAAQEGRSQAIQGQGVVPPPASAGSSRLAEPSTIRGEAPIPDIIVPTQTSPVVSPEQLRFTAFHRKEVVVETWNTLLVYTHIEPALQEIYRDVDKFKNELGNAPRKVSAQATQLVLRETNITIVPECKGVTFNPKRTTFTWLEDWHRANFRFLVKKELAGSAGNGKINIFAGPLLIGTLKMALLFEEQIDLSQSRETVTEVTTGLYKQIFASYSHDDTPIVLSCRNIYKALGFNVLIDIDTLRAGQVFSEALKRMIDNADIFQLFWSERSAKSAYVELEWEHALQLNKGEGFVRPVYWELPLVPPPARLTALQFAYLPAYTFTYPS